MAEIASLGWTPKFSYTYTVSYKMAHLKNELFYGQVQIVSISSTWLSIKVISVSYRIQVLLKTCARYLTMCSRQLLKLLHSFFTRKVTWSLAKLEWPRCERTSKLLANRKRKSLYIKIHRSQTGKQHALAWNLEWCWNYPAWDLVQNPCTFYLFWETFKSGICSLSSGLSIPFAVQHFGKNVQTVQAVKDWQESSSRSSAFVCQREAVPTWQCRGGVYILGLYSSSVAEVLKLKRMTNSRTVPTE